MENEKRDFDREAAAWDGNAARVKLGKDIARTISEQVELTREMDVLDFGCGTGLLSFQIQPHVRSITGVDSSQGMLDIFNRKAAELRVKNTKPILFDLDSGETLKGNYDLVVSNMTLHHVKKIEPLLDQLYAVTAPSGHLCISDLDPENGQFHEDDTGVFHNGFDRSTLRKMFTEAGFEDVRDIDAAEFVKPGTDGKVRHFSVFLMIGRKN